MDESEIGVSLKQGQGEVPQSSGNLDFPYNGFYQQVSHLLYEHYWSYIALIFSKVNEYIGLLPLEDVVALDHKCVCHLPCDGV